MLAPFPAPLVQFARALGGSEARASLESSPRDAFWRIFLSEVASGRRRRLAVGLTVASDVIFFACRGSEGALFLVGTLCDVYAAREARKVLAFKSTKKKY